MTTASKWQLLRCSCLQQPSRQTVHNLLCGEDRCFAAAQPPRLPCGQLSCRLAEAQSVSIVHAASSLKMREGRERHLRFSLTAYHIGRRFPARMQGLVPYSSMSVFASPALRPARLATRTSAAIPARLHPNGDGRVHGLLSSLLPSCYSAYAAVRPCSWRLFASNEKGAQRNCSRRSAAPQTLGRKITFEGTSRRRAPP